MVIVWKSLKSRNGLKFSINVTSVVFSMLKITSGFKIFKESAHGFIDFSRNLAAFF